MTINISVPEATSQFAELLSRVKQGEDVLILEAGVAIARLVPAPHSRLPCTPGQDAGRVVIAPDFNAPLPDDVLNAFLNPPCVIAVRILLDTHAFLWWVMNDSQLSDTARGLIANPNNDILFSAASAWEIVIKVNIGKLALPEPPIFHLVLPPISLETLPIQINHVLQITSLPNHRCDPFDRILIAQSQVEQAPILTTDDLIIRYPVNVIW